MVNLRAMETMRIMVAQLLPMGQISTEEMMALIPLTQLNGLLILEAESRIPSHRTVLVGFHMDS
jgi:hypothetical protein